MHRSPASRERDLAAGAVLAGAGTLAIVASLVAFGPDWLLQRDAGHYHQVASSFVGDGSFEELDAYRLARPMYPAASALLAAGQRSLLVFGMVAAYIVSLFGTGFFASRATDGRLPLLALLAVPALWLTLPVLIAEPMVTALVLMAYAVARRSTSGAAATGALALLVKETAIVALFPLALRGIREKSAKTVLTWAASVLPLMAWWLVTRRATGHWPWQEIPGLGRPAITVPFAGMVEALVHRGGPSGGRDAIWMAAAVAIGAGTFVVACLTLRRRPSSELAQAAAASALLLVAAGYSTWAQPAEAFRLMLLVQMLILVSHFERGRRKRVRRRGPNQVPMKAG